MANRRPTPRPGNQPPRRGPTPGGPARRSPQQAGPDRTRDRDRAKLPPREGEGGLERLQKVLAHAGVSSRRACEELILQGRVTVDGQTIRELGTKIDPRRQVVALDGQKVHSERNVYYAVHKPKGYVSTNNDPSGKPLVVNLLPEIPQRVYSVGRLDEQSTGLMLMTNDGELANKLAHPRFGVEKIYRVVVAGEPGREVLDQLTQGIWLAEGKVRAKRVKITGRKGQATVLEMVLAEGKNREIRRMLAKLGHKVMSLTRIAVGPIGLKGLGVGECRPLTGQEIELLRKVAAGMILHPPRYPDRRDRAPRPEGKRPARPPITAEGGPEPGRRHDRPGPSQQRPGRPGPRPPYSQGPRPAQGQRPGQGPPPRPIAAQGPGPVPGAGQRPPKPASSREPLSRPPVPPRADGSTRQIIGLNPEPAPRRGGPTGPRLHRPAPKRFPRAAQGLKRPPRQEEGSEE